MIAWSGPVQGDDSDSLQWLRFVAGRGHQALSQDTSNAQLGADVVAMQTDGAGPDPVTLARTCDFTFGRCHYASNCCQ